VATITRKWAGASLSKTKHRFAFFLCCAFAVWSQSAVALEAIDTDGPDFVESSEVLAPGHFQYEVDVISSSGSRAAPGSALIATPGLLKYGIAKDFEIRLAPNGFEQINGESGWGDTALGIKWHAQDRDPQHGRPAISWLLHVDTPSGQAPFRGNGLRPSLRSVITWDLPHDFALGWMPGIKSDTGADGHRFSAFILGIVLNQRINEATRVFVEFAAPQIAASSDGGVIASWDIGAAYLISNDIQLGVRTGIAANANSPNSFLLFELAQRF